MRIKLIFWLLLPSFGLFFVLSYFIRGTEGKENLEVQIQTAEAQGFDKDTVREKMLKNFDDNGYLLYPKNWPSVPKRVYIGFKIPPFYSVGNIPKNHIPPRPSIIFYV